ncbi:MAG: YggT family protein [Alphaproteobacteria bacterium]|nr:YggT family protein [Alphaproteobacteria bacterium]
MNSVDFLLDYPLFTLANYGLAVVAWTCIGRFILGGFLGPDSPHYILRFFRRLTDWAVRIVRVITPSYVPDGILPLIAFVWLFVLRVVIGAMLLAYGLAPRLGPAAAAAGGGG